MSPHALPDYDGEIFKVDMTGKLLGKFGHAGRLAKEFNGVNQIECRTENELWAAEIGNWRVSKITLRGEPSTTEVVFRRKAAPPVMPDGYSLVTGCRLVMTIGLACIRPLFFGGVRL